MRLDLGTHVFLRDGADAGMIERLAVDPATLRVLYIILHRGLHLGHDVLIPLELLRVEPSGVVQLSISARKLDHLSGLHQGEEHGGSNFRVPHIRHLPGPLSWPAHYPYQHPEGDLGTILPEGTVELSDSTAVDALDGLVGTLCGVQLHGERQEIDGLIVRVGTILRRDILMPISWVKHLDGVQIQLTKTKDEIKRHAAPARRDAPDRGAQAG